MFQLIENSIPQEIIEQSRVQTFAHNDPIIQSNQSLDSLFYIMKGRAKIYQYTDNGREIFIHFLSENDWIGELTFLGIEEATKNVVSVGETTVLAIPKQVVYNQLLFDSHFLLELNRFIGKKLLDRTRYFVKNQGYDVKYRLATLMIDMSHDNIYSEKHTSIVNYLGTSYRHLLQTIKDFQEKGFIEKVGRSTYVINKEKLLPYYIQL
ncbi:cyclic nucleotide-binding domain-containing protein [Streptococcus suis]|nr:cyclic nucleotide-binding domain-containing protein [Streptococcus suis]